MGKSIIKVVLLLTTLFYSVPARAQSLVIDSLEQLIKKPGTSSGQRIEAMGRVAEILAAQNKLPQALAIAHKAIVLSHQEKDRRHAALTQSTLAYLHVQQDSLLLAFQAIDSARFYSTLTSDQVVKGRVIFRKGWLEHIVGNTDQAYQHMLEALRLLKNDNNTSLYKSNIYHYLAAIHAQWGNTDKQLHYTRLCQKEALRSANPDAILNANLSVASSYLYRFRRDKSQQQYLDSAKYFFGSVLKLSDSLAKQITLPSTPGIAALNMANIYYEFYPLSFQDSAKLFLDKALLVGRKVNNVEIIANSFGIRSEYAQKSGDNKLAEMLLLKALTEISNTPGEFLAKARITEALAQVTQKNGNPTKALEYYKQFMIYDRQLFDKEKLAISQRLEAQYQSEKKELAYTIAKQEVAFNKKLNIYYLLIIIATFIALIFLYRFYRYKLKFAHRQQRLLSIEKDKTALQINLKIEETARLHAERELTREKLNRLEKERLTGTLQVEEKNMLMQAVKEKMALLAKDDPLHHQIKNMIYKNQHLDKGYDEIRTEFSEISSALVAGLQHKADNKLTRLDLKYCAYFLLGFTTKEIAMKLNVDPKSIRMARYRIKQKLNLHKEDTLDRFLSDLEKKHRYKE